MARIILGLLIFLSTVSTATATLSPRKDELRLAKVLFAERIEKSTPPRQAEGFRITGGTEIRLNGRPCRYEDVPAHATVVFLELEPDGKTAIRVHFRTKK